MKKEILIAIAMIILGLVLCGLDIHSAVDTVGAFMFIVGIVLFIVSIKKKNKAKPVQTANFKGRYIANPDTKVFHEPDCHSLINMDLKKYTVLNVSRDTLIKEGYKPCKKCEP